MVPTFKILRYCKVLSLCVLMCNSVEGFLFRNSIENDGEDLGLSKAEESDIESLSRYGWAYYLSLDEEVDFERISKEYVSSIQNNPNSEFLIKEILKFWSKYPQEAINEQIASHLQDSARKNPQSILLNQVVAKATIQQGHPSRALELLLASFREAKWTDPSLISDLGGCYFKAGNFKKADKLFRKATQAKNLKGNYFVEAAAALFYDAISLDDTLKISKRKRDSYRHLANEHALIAADSFEISHLKENHEEVMDLVTLLLEGNFTEKAVRVLSMLNDSGRINSDALILLAQCYEAREQYEEALGIWKKISDKFPFNPNFHVRMGRTLVRLERNQDALLSYQTAFRLTSNPAIAFEIVSLYVRLKRPEKALELVSLLPFDVLNSHLLEAQIFKSSNQSEKALRVLLRAKKAAEEKKIKGGLTLDYYLSLAAVYHSLDKKNELIESLEKALKLSPDSPEANNFLGYFLADENMNLDRAEKLILRALEVDPENPAFLDSLAWVFFRKGNFNEAANHIDSALASKELLIDGVILDHAGDIYFSLGNKTKAILFWKGSLENEIKETDRIRQKILEAEKQGP